MENVSQELLERYGKRVGNVDTEKVQIFPGVGMVNMVKEDDANRLEIGELLQKLVGTYYSTEEQIDIALSGLRRYGEICDCESPVVFKQIDCEGEFDEIFVSCLKCGGLVDK